MKRRGEWNHRKCDKDGKRAREENFEWGKKEREKNKRNLPTRARCRLLLQASQIFSEGCVLANRSSSSDFCCLSLPPKRLGENFPRQGLSSPWWTSSQRKHSPCFGPSHLVWPSTKQEKTRKENRRKKQKKKEKIPFIPPLEKKEDERLDEH